MMRLITLLSLFYLSQISQLNGQDYYPMSFFIIDKDSGKAVENARVSIKEIGFQSKDSGHDGKVYFQEVPVGEINYFVSCNGYNGIEGAFNVTTEIKSNTKRILLTKIPTSEKILISGEVIDNDGNDISGANVEIKAGRNIQNSITDESGNFNIDFNLDEIDNGVTNFLLEVTKGGCKKKDRFVIPKSNYIYKEIKIDCNSGEIKPENGYALGEIPQQWKGDYDQFNYPKPYKMVLYIEESIGESISGKLNWPDLNNSITSFKGEIVTRPANFIEETKWKILDKELKNKKGIWIKFIEKNMVSGSGVQLNGQYYCHISDRGILTGVGFSQNSTSAGGKFILIKD